MIIFQRKVITKSETAMIRNPLEVYKILPKSNCGDCYLPTCLAFAAAVIRGDKQLADCPHLKKDGEAEKLAGRINIKGREESRDRKIEEHLALLKKQISQLDFPEAAARLGASIADEKLAVKCLGKNFMVDRHGNISSQCHTHDGLAIPLLSYLLHPQTKMQVGQWVPFRELKDGAVMAPLFEQRCEKTLKQIADQHTDLFEDLIDIFSGERANSNFGADISLILYPLPKIAIMICYWEPEDDLESVLNVFFYSTADKYLDIRSIYALAAGLVMMFEKIVQRHIE